MNSSGLSVLQRSTDPKRNIFKPAFFATVIVSLALLSVLIFFLVRAIESYVYNSEIQRTLDQSNSFNFTVVEIFSRDFESFT